MGRQTWDTRRGTPNVGRQTWDTEANLFGIFKADMLSVSECIKDIKQTEHQGCKQGRAEDAGDTGKQDVVDGGGGLLVKGYSRV